MPRQIRVGRRALMAIGTVLVLAALGLQVSMIGGDGDNSIAQAACRPIDWSTVPPRKVGRAAVLAMTEMPEQELAQWKTEKRPVGDLQVEGGCIVGTDPLVFADRLPFLGTVPPGRYPVTSYHHDGGVALLEVRFARGRVERWEPALIGTEKMSTLSDGDTFGYPVDAGVGSLMDVAGQVALRTYLTRQGDKIDADRDPFIAMQRSRQRQMLLQPLEGNPANVAVVSSGWGDGVYTTYWGLDAAHRPLVLVTDFDVIDDDSQTTDSQAQP